MRHISVVRCACVAVLGMAAGVGCAQGVASDSGANGAEATVRSADLQSAGIVRIPGAAMALLLAQSVPAQCPEEMLGKPAGAVILHAVIGKDGSVESLSVVSGPQSLRSPALDAVKQWRYRPFVLDGQPREVETTILVTFNRDAQ